MTNWQSRSSVKSFRTRSGFTLIELLVVVAIIAVLMAVMLPALSRARGQAKSVACSANLRAIGQAFAAYVSEWDGTLPPNYFRQTEDGNSYETWAWALSKSTGRSYTDWRSAPASSNTFNPKIGMWRCSENMVQNKPCGTSAGETSTSYGANTWENNSTWATYDNRYLSTKDEGVKFTRFSSPSELYAVIEATYFRTEAWYNDGGALLTPTTGQSIPFMNSGITYARYPHNLGMNILFADGHVEFTKGPLLGRGSQRSGAAALSSSDPDKWTNGNHWWTK